MIPGRNFLGPLLLILLAPSFALSLHYIVTHMDGSLILFWIRCKEKGVLSMLSHLWLNFRSLYVWKMILAYLGFELMLCKLVPGASKAGPITPGGNTPIYKMNGVQCYFITLLAFGAGAYCNVWKGGVIFDHLGPILSSCNVLALILCADLYVKGLLMPSSSDSGSTGNVVFDFYWGTELHPRILGWDVKQFLICRVSMTFWALCVTSCMLKQYDTFGVVSNAMAVSVALQFIYITKFFVWESGYMSTVDIMHDRVGFYLCWGVLVWLPSLHTCHTVYMASKAIENDKDFWSNVFLLVAGIACILINYDCDRQRQQFRATQGRCKVWGGDPLFIEAHYKTHERDSSTTRTQLLLASGWWGLARHFNYVPELGAALCWSLPAGVRRIAPLSYPLYLTVLLCDRVFRDEARCRSKYGRYWDCYCSHVPYRMIPGVW